MNTNTEFEKLISNFYQRNSISSPSDEKYLQGFRRHLGQFLSQIDDESVKQIVANCISNTYRYYTEKEIKSVLRDFHQNLINQLTERQLELNDCHFASILNSQTYKHNSSNAMLNLYLEINNLPNSIYYNFYDVADLEFGRKNFLSETNQDFNHYNDEFYNKESKRLKAEWEERLANKNFLILFDDYAGSGNTVKKFIKMIRKYVNNDLIIVIYFIHLTARAETRIKNFLNQNEIRYIVGSYEKSDKFFSENTENRIQIKNFKNFDNPLGYDNTESVLTTYKNTPNNTLEMFWNDRVDDGGWRALFPRNKKSGGNYRGMSEWVKERKKLLWFITYRKIPENIQLKIIVLLYIKNNLKLSSIVEVELSNIICYTDAIIQECQDENLIELTNQKYQLLNGGIELLKSNSLDKVKFNQIQNEYESIAKQKEIPLLKI